MGRRAWILVWCALASVPSARGQARPPTAQIDLTRLPPAATNHIDFARDVQPIFDRSCLRCHGPERPKSKFRLDNRAAALQGGENNREDIIPGDSAHSPLIHYIARLVKEMEMPTPREGEPLTPAQIGILRAWIDQGAEWTGSVVETAQSTAALFGGGYFVSGNRSVFHELLWRPVGGNGGLEEFTLRQNLDAWSRFFMEGHSWRDDTSLKVQVERSTLGFVRLGVDQYRKYYSDSGGYYPFFSPSVYSLGRDLHMDIGKAYVDFGLTLRSEERRVGKECRSRWLRYLSSRRRHTRCLSDWSSDVCSSDLSLKVQVERSTLGFVRLGVDQYRKYYSDSGGYYPFFSPSVYSLGRDLHMDIGKAYVDFGLTL